jgi:hypothetical protein
VISYLFEVGHHDGKGLAGAALPFTKDPHSTEVRGIAGEMKSTQTLKAEDRS